MCIRAIRWHNNRSIKLDHCERVSVSWGRREEKDVPLSIAILSTSLHVIHLTVIVFISEFHETHVLFICYAIISISCRPSGCTESDKHHICWRHPRISYLIGRLSWGNTQLIDSAVSENLLATIESKILKMCSTSLDIVFGNLTLCVRPFLT